MIIPNFLALPVHWMINTKQSKPPSLYISNYHSGRKQDNDKWITEKKRTECHLQTWNLIVHCAWTESILKIRFMSKVSCRWMMIATGLA